MKKLLAFKYCFLILFALMISACHCSKKVTDATNYTTQKSIQPMASSPALVYKTKKDYTKFVPVIMNTEKTRIISYPKPTDIYYEGKLAYPTPLNEEYFLDNRGIGPNVVFLNITYEAYSQFKSVPTMEFLMNSIQDKKPLLVLWDCGVRSKFNNEVNELNSLIGKGFSGCTNLVKEYKVNSEH